MSTKSRNERPLWASSDELLVDSSSSPLPSHTLWIELLLLARLSSNVLYTLFVPDG